MRDTRRRRRGSGCLVALFILCVIMAALVGGTFFVLFKGEEIPVKEVIESVFEPIPFQEVTIQEEALGQKYYYSQLRDEEQKKVYKQLLQGINENSPEIYVNYEEAEVVNRLFLKVLHDFPEIFWCEGGISTQSFSGAESYSIAKVAYLYEGEEKEQRKALIKEAVDQCLVGIPTEWSTYEKIKYVYEYIINTTDYDMGAPDNQNICSVFIGKRSVCAGYARATQYLLERLGIFCTYVMGEATTPDNHTNSSHAWNLVQIDGDYYYVDTTWGDPVFSRDSADDIPLEMEAINYDYLCANDAELFNSTHALAEDIKDIMPACTSTTYDYYKINGWYYESFEREQISLEMNRIIDEMGNPTRMKFANDDAFYAAKDALENELFEESAQYLMRTHRLSSVRYYYQLNERMRTITIYWGYEPT